MAEKGAHTDAHDLSARLLSMLDIPCWLQLPQRDFHLFFTAVLFVKYFSISR